MPVFLGILGWMIWNSLRTHSLEKDPKVDREIVIKYTGETFREEGFPEFGIFTIANLGSAKEQLAFVREEEGSYLSQPIYLYRDNNAWNPIPVSYAGIVIHSEIKPGERISFHTPIALLKNYPQSEFKLVISGYESLPFFLSKEKEASDLE